MATALDTSVYENKVVGELNGVRLYRRSEGPEPGFTLQVDGKVKKFVRATRAWKAELAAITKEAEALAGGPLVEPQPKRIKIQGNTLPPEDYEQARMLGGFAAQLRPTVEAFGEDLGQRRRVGPLGADAEQIA
ncbi:hypothetical protein SE17_00695 [Kouleothrix aurantiaca]|uniref:Uncharacterized protein n=1 Tax=Kouleothrix aurantiaca TaxID=186479 RepID=A0A0P9DHE9_9CHLR|nr:hypothetical protein SE17_00695 [Kouleothrix aurantiaca]